MPAHQGVPSLMSSGLPDILDGAIAFLRAPRWNSNALMQSGLQAWYVSV
jgi:hypothetical protein